MRAHIVSDEFVKQVFDHVRNIGIAGLVYAAAWYFVQRHQQATLFDVAVAGLLALLATALFLLNQFHLVHKLRISGVPGRTILIACAVYDLVALGIVMAAIR